MVAGSFANPSGRPDTDDNPRRVPDDTERDIQEFLRKTMRVTGKVLDPEGDEGTGERMVTLSDTII